MFTLDTLFTAVGLAGALAMATPIVRQDCASVYLIHAAGTSESGLGAVGEPLSGNLTSALPSFSSVGLDSSVEYVVTVAEGAQTLADLIASQASACPDQRFILSGYSKGAMVVHSSTADLTDDLISKVCGIAVFGDPDDEKGLGAIYGLADTWPIAEPQIGTNILEFCNEGDPVCDGGADIDAHLAYPSDGSVLQAATGLAAVCA
ncbi:alpha/beta-hydrolase [Schizophyllum commune H4-8]|uniref:alpha/beta-hydrolase n=1 Tax=Schizophyllum commune (strain H4-8 / FGSC 9210) TaxID=578458 RepID=UPI00215F49D4|nr:alpha/beta-hydrolase [Schizophyllum commune H4-8]KAI5892053.1 alpha/beta-hydrolase [Schizophyllum commune H4-8]